MGDSSNHIKIRVYKSSDKDQVCKLMQEFCEFYLPINPYRKESVDSEKVGIYHTNKMIKFTTEHGGIIFVAEDSSDIIGFAGMHLKNQSEEDKMEDMPMRLGELGALFVTSEYRGHGTGKQLIEKSEEYFRSKGCTHSYLSVRAYNKNAYEIYKSHGYNDLDVKMIKTL